MDPVLFIYIVPNKQMLHFTILEQFYLHQISMSNLLDTVFLQYTIFIWDVEWLRFLLHLVYLLLIIELVSMRLGTSVALCLQMKNMDTSLFINLMILLVVWILLNSLFFISVFSFLFSLNILLSMYIFISCSNILLYCYSQLLHGFFFSFWLILLT